MALLNSLPVGLDEGNFTGGVDDCYFSNMFGDTSTLDLGCVVSKACSGVNSHYVYLFVVMVLLYFMVLWFLKLVSWLDDKSFRERGKSIFYERNVYLSDFGFKSNLKLGYVGWRNFNDFAFWVYQTALLWVAMVGVLLLYLNGVFGFVFEFLKDISWITFF